METVQGEMTVEAEVKG